MSDRPHRSSLDSLKKEAKKWLQALRAGSDAAHARLSRVLPNTPSAPTLRDVQLALAREHGFPGWADLKAAVERLRQEDRQASQASQAFYEAAADALLEAYQTGTPAAMERHYGYTWHRRPWLAMRTYVQLDLGKRPVHPGDAIDITREDARHLVAVEYGFANWNALTAYAQSMRGGRRLAAKPVHIVSGEDWGDWRTIASSRDWDEIIQRLRAHPDAGLNAEGQMTDAILADACRVETLAAVGLSGCSAVTDEGVRHLAQLPALRHLDLSGTGVTDAGLQVLRRLPELRTLSLAGTRITDAGAAELAGCHRLERLNLAWTRAGGGALRALAGKAALRHLTIAVSDDDLALLHELPAFKSWQGGEAKLGMVGHASIPNHLGLAGSFTDRGMRHLRGLDGLYGLEIDGRAAITAAGLEPLTNLPRLGSLSANIADDGMSWVARMPSLRSLTAQDTPAGDRGFQALSASQSIEYIWGRRCHNLRRAGFIALANMPNLRGLSVSCLNVDDDGVAALPSFPALRELMPMDVPDAGYRHIGRCKRLESLVLMYCRETTDAATEQITGLPNLTSYFNSYTEITDRTPSLLSTMDSLERVTFDVCHRLTNEGLAQLARLPNLRELRVAGKGVTRDLRAAFPDCVAVSVN